MFSVLFIFARYKLRKHSSTVHKFQPLMYTNLITGENCIGTKINYEGAVFPNRESKADRNIVPQVENILEETNSSNRTHRASTSSSNSENSESSESDAEDTSEYEEFDQVSVSSNAECYAGLKLRCPRCEFTSVSEQEVLMHLHLHRTNPELNRWVICPTSNTADMSSPTTEEAAANTKAANTPVGVFRCALCDFTTESWQELSLHRKNSHSLEKPYKCCYCEYSAYLQIPVMLHCVKEHPEETVSLETRDVSVKLDLKTEDCDDVGSSSVDFNPKTSIHHFHPSIVLRNFLDLPIELLHAFMVQNGLSEIHQ